MISMFKKVIVGFIALSLALMCAACGTDTGRETESGLGSQSSSIGDNVTRNPDTGESKDESQDEGGTKTVKEITSDQVRVLTADMTMKDVIEALGETKDVGSGNFVLMYLVDGTQTVQLSFADENSVLGQDGDAILEGAQPIAR